MSACNFEYLLQFVNKQLDLDGQLEVFNHLDRCDICRDAVYQLSRDRDEALFLFRVQCLKPYAIQNHIAMVWSRLAQVKANALARTAARRSSDRQQ